MANPEHVKVVRQGAEAIAEWWREQPRALFTGQVALDLSSADLNEVDLSEAMLAGADLSNAQLERALLVRTSLVRANLCGANLTGARLIQTDFKGADLSAVDLSHTDLARADFGGATLKGARMFSARLFGTVFSDADLNGTRDLDSLIHAGPSVIDERTLRRSWPLPEVFLRGVGLSDNLITYLPSLVNQAIEFYSCFISYSSEDDEFTRRLHADLQANGVRCWFAPDDLRIGDKFRVRIDEAIRLHDKLLLILSEHSVKSAWVEDEVENAFDKERKSRDRGEDRTVLFPIRLDSAVVETDAAWATAIGRTRHIGDFTAWKEHDAYQAAFERLLKDLKTDVKSDAKGS